MTKDEHDQVRGPAAVGAEVSQERRVGCPLGERDLGLAAQRVSRDRDLDQEEVALVEVPDVRPRVDGRVWDGLEHQVRHPLWDRSGQIARHDQVELVRPVPDDLRPDPSVPTGDGSPCGIALSTQRATLLILLCDPSAPTMMAASGGVGSFNASVLALGNFFYALVNGKMLHVNVPYYQRAYVWDAQRAVDLFKTSSASAKGRDSHRRHTSLEPSCLLQPTLRRSTTFPKR